MHTNSAEIVSVAYDSAASCCKQALTLIDFRNGGFECNGDVSSIDLGLKRFSVESIGHDDLAGSDCAIRRGTPTSHSRGTILRFNWTPSHLYRKGSDFH